MEQLFCLQKHFRRFTSQSTANTQKESKATATSMVILLLPKASAEKQTQLFLSALRTQSLAGCSTRTLRLFLYTCCCHSLSTKSKQQHRLSLNACCSQLQKQALRTSLLLVPCSCWLLLLRALSFCLAATGRVYLCCFSAQALIFSVLKGRKGTMIPKTNCKKGPLNSLYLRSTSS